MYIALQEHQQHKTIPLVELQPDSRFTSSAQEENSNCTNYLYVTVLTT